MMLENLTDLRKAVEADMEGKWTAQTVLEAIARLTPPDVAGLLTDIENSAWNCDEWPDWLHEVVEKTNEVSDRLDMSAEQAYAYAILSAATALRLSAASLSGGWRETAAARDVLTERRRQIEAEGWTPEHDDQNSSGQIAYAASVYALCAASNPSDRAVMDEHGSYVSVPFRVRNRWPWAESWLKPTNRRRDLVKAGALILAEIERLDRLPASPTVEGA